MHPFVFFFVNSHTAGWFPFRRQAHVEEPDHRQPPEIQPNQQNENRNTDQVGTFFCLILKLSLIS